MSSASFIQEPYPSTFLFYREEFNDLYDNIELCFIEDPYKIFAIFVDDKRTYFIHRDVLRYMIKILRFSKEDLKEYFCWRFEFQICGINYEKTADVEGLEFFDDSDVEDTKITQMNKIYFLENIVVKTCLNDSERIEKNLRILSLIFEQ